MKKILLSLLLLTSLGLAQAQPNKAYADNTFYLSAGVGAFDYMNVAGSEFGAPSFGLDVGTWLMRPLAFQLSIDGAMAKSSYGSSATFLFASAEFKWDINATFFHVYNKTFQYPIPFYPMIGLGLLYRNEVSAEGESYGADNDFHAMLGLQMPVRIGKLWDANLEYKCFFLPQGFDGSNGDNYLHMLTLGLTRRWSDDPYHRRTRHESRNTSEDWFVGFGLGGQLSSIGFDHAFDLNAKMWQLVPDIMFGRNYSHVWTIRFELSGYFARERYKEATETLGMPYKFNYLHTDFMVNLSHLFGFKRGSRFSTFAYLGAGPVWRYDRPTFTVAADGGIMERFYLNPDGDLFLDLKYIMVPPRVAGNYGEIGSIFSVGFPSLTFGYIHNFGHSTTRYRMPVNAVNNY